MDKQEAHVICLNDSVEYVFIGLYEDAKEHLKLLAKDYYDRMGLKFKFNSYEEYRKSRYYWHIHSVPTNYTGER